MVGVRGLRLSAVFILTIAAIGMGTIVARAEEFAVTSRVRSSHPYIRAMLEEARERSATFRGLVQAIEATDGIVYVEQGPCGHGVRACLTLSITPAAEYRILRVLVDARQPDWEVMASIGHELQHALEVLNDLALKTGEEMFLFYAREGLNMERSFETGNAIRAGNAVKNEVVSFSRKSQPR
jgi:hypothetical protein